MNELKPCPFCGETEDVTIRIKEYIGNCKEICGHVFAYIECLPCDAKTTYCFEADVQYHGHNNCVDMAIASWNQRTPNWISVKSFPPPKDKPIQLWHKVHKCPIACISYIDEEGTNWWIELTKTTMWPLLAFTHWQPLPEAPR